MKDTPWDYGLRVTAEADGLVGHAGAVLLRKLAGARKYVAAGRDYALYRTLYLAGLRAEEPASMDRADVHFGRGPFGKLHVRFGKGALTSGPRPRWVPMLDGLDLILRWYLDEIRPRLGDGPALFCDEGGGRIHRGTGTAGRALRAFFTSRGLTLPGDEKQRRAAARRRRHLDAVPDCLAAAVAAFNHSQLAEQERARRTGRRPLSDITLETRLRILRDLAVHLTSAGPVTGWSQVTIADLEGFLGHSPGSRLGCS